ncbi:response regulator [Paraburkholderia caledonica]|uniref:CheY-like chemotaxis protein n=1 Tax=Paraburkholderia caledonica TaxID=134536 RepID=A0AB73IL21_9BURK|nr:CheY-like chemotaxis protein [Paraburkholderia caledonica]
MTELAGLKALVVEDEGSVALLIEEMLESFGCEIAASLARVDQAREFASKGIFDFAVLDVNLHGQPVFPVAHILCERQIPFVFSTGYGADGVPAGFNASPVLAKPFGIADLKRAVSSALASSSH